MSETREKGDNTISGDKGPTRILDRKLGQLGASSIEPESKSPTAN